MIAPAPIGEEAGVARVFGETPKTAVETTALPKANASFRLRPVLGDVLQAVFEARERDSSL
jgi:hypothetical protein